MEIAPVNGAAADFVYGLESKHEYLKLVRYYAPPNNPTTAQIADAEHLVVVGPLIRAGEVQYALVRHFLADVHRAAES